MPNIQFENRDGILHVLHDGIQDIKIVIRKVVPAYPLDQDYLVIFSHVPGVSEDTLGKVEWDIIRAAEKLVGVNRYDLTFNDMISRSLPVSVLIHEK